MTGMGRDDHERDVRAALAAYGRMSVGGMTRSELDVVHRLHAQGRVEREGAAASNHDRRNDRLPGDCRSRQVER